MGTTAVFDGVELDVPDDLDPAGKLAYERAALAKLGKPHPHDTYLASLNLSPDATSDQVIAAQQKKASAP